MKGEKGLEQETPGQRGARRPAELAGSPRGRKAKYYDGSRPVAEKLPRKKFEVSEMQDIHHEITRRLLLGQKKTYIARQLGVSAQMVNYTADSAVVQDRLALLRSDRDSKAIDVAAHIRKIAPKSIQLLEDVITGRGDGADAPISLRCKVAESNLDRAGFGAVKKFQGAVGHFTKDDIQDLKNEALKRITPVEATG
jgi:hypothetical protein